MDFFNSFMIPPNEGYLNLLRFLLVICLSISTPYLGILLASTALSVGFNTRDRDIPNSTFARIAKDLMDMAAPSRTVIFVLGVLPLIVLWVIYGQWLYQSNATAAMNLMPVGIIITIIGLYMAFYYRETLYPDGRNSEINWGMGVGAAKMMFLGTYVVVACITRFNDPERWHLMYNPIRQLISFNIIWKHMYFVHAGVALTGAALLYFFVDWSGSKPKMDEGYARFTRRLGASIAMAMLTALPVLGFFYMVTTPHMAKSGATFNVAAAQMGLLFVIFLFLLAALKGRQKLGQPIFIMFLAFIVLTAFTDQNSLVNATKEHTAKLITESEEREALLALEREAERADAMVVDVVKGEEIYNSVCITCHRMDEKLVGPPLNQVLAKYAGNMDGLVEFIQAPSKIDPAYPPMPAPGLSLADTRSVAAFLLGEEPAEGGAEESHDTGGH